MFGSNSFKVYSALSRRLFSTVNVTIAAGGNGAHAATVLAGQVKHVKVHVLSTFADEAERMGKACESAGGIRVLSKDVSVEPVTPAVISKKSKGYFTRDNQNNELIVKGGSVRILPKELLVLSENIYILHNIIGSERAEQVLEEQRTPSCAFSSGWGMLSDVLMEVQTKTLTLVELITNQPMKIGAAFLMDKPEGHLIHHDGAFGWHFTAVVGLSDTYEGGVLKLYEEPYLEPGPEDEEQYKELGILNSKCHSFPLEKLYLNAVLFTGEIVHEVNPREGARVVFVMHFWRKEKTEIKKISHESAS